MNNLPDFLVMFRALIDLQDKIGDVTWDVSSDGILIVRAYVGIENYDLVRQGRQMFAPA